MIGQTAESFERLVDVLEQDRQTLTLTAAQIAQAVAKAPPPTCAPSASSPGPLGLFWRRWRLLKRETPCVRRDSRDSQE